MTVTHEAVGEVIEHIFTAQPVVNDKFVAFGVINDHYMAEVIISVYNDSLTSHSTGQVMDIFFWLVDSEGNRLSLHPDGLANVLAICKQVQDRIDWGTLGPYQESEGKGIEIALSRRIDVTESDMCMAMNRDWDSAFMRTLQRLTHEWEYVNQILVCVAAGQISAGGKELELLLETAAGQA